MITREGKYIKLDAEERARIKFDEATRCVAGAALHEAGGLDVEISRSTSELGVGIFLRTLAQRALLRKLRAQQYEDSDDMGLRMQVSSLQQTAYDQAQAGRDVLNQLTQYEQDTLVLPTVQDYLRYGMLPEAMESSAVEPDTSVRTPSQTIHTVHRMNIGWRYGGAA